MTYSQFQDETGPHRVRKGDGGDLPERTRSSEVNWWSPFGVVSPRIPLVLLLVGLVLQAVDMLLAKNAFDVLVNVNEVVSWLVAVATAGIGALTAIGAGIALRSRHRMAAVLLLVAWTIIGVAMALIRYNTGTIQGDDGNTTADRVLAGLMLALYLGAGADICYQATKLWNPARARMRKAKRTITGIDRRLPSLEATYARVTNALGRTTTQEHLQREQYLSALAYVESQERKLKNIARITLLELLGDPKHSAVYRQPHHPES
jgi:hypothetical protein